MAAAGDRTTFCEFLIPPRRKGLGEAATDVKQWTPWVEAWAKKVGLRGGELTLARETQSHETEDFWFDYRDLINPNGDGRSVDSTMAIRVETDLPEGQLYDIDGIFPDEVNREEVRIRAVRKRLPV